MEALVTISENKATTSSLLIAEAFEKQHKNILRDIASLECSEEFNRLNFEPVAYKDSKGELRPMFNITRDGFVWLAMGFTGKKAAEFKEKFIAAFNAMEQALIEGQGERRRIEINHSRRTNAPEGLDIRYTLDLTKLVMKPNAAGIELVERLTGIDMSGIVVDGPVTSDFAEKVFAEWVPCLQPAEDKKILFATLYAHFQQYYFAHQGSDPAPVPSRIWLSKKLKKCEYLVKGQSGSMYVWGVALGSSD